MDIELLNNKENTSIQSGDTLPFSTIPTINNISPKKGDSEVLDSNDNDIIVPSTSSPLDVQGTDEAAWEPNLASKSLKVPAPKKKPKTKKKSANQSYSTYNSLSSIPYSSTLSTLNTNPNNNNTSSALGGTSSSTGITLSPSTKRQLELEAYASLITAFRAQGELTWKKESILHELRLLLRVSDERHKLELKRVEETFGNFNISANAMTSNIDNTFSLSRSKRYTPYDYDSQESPSSDPESNSDADFIRQRKKQRVGYTGGDSTTFSAIPFPSSDNQPAYINRPKTKGKKKEKEPKEPKEGKEKKKVYRKKPGPKPESERLRIKLAGQDKGTNLSTLSSTSSKAEEQAIYDSLALLEADGLPPDIIEAKESGDLNRLKQALERHKEQVRAQIEAMK